MIADADRGHHARRYNSRRSQGGGFDHSDSSCAGRATPVLHSNEGLALLSPGVARFRIGRKHKVRRNTLGNGGGQGGQISLV